MSNEGEIEMGPEEGGQGSSDVGDSKKEKHKLEGIAAHTPMEILSGLVAGVAATASVGAMVLSPAPIVFIAGGLSIVAGGYSYHQQVKLTDIKALKETHESVKRNVDRLALENQRLNETVGDLSNTVDGLEDVEQALDVITQTQGQSVATFKEQVKENRDILGQMQKNLRANVLQNLLQVVIRSDQDDNMTIEEDEIDPLISRIKKINGVEVRKDRFKSLIMKSGGSLASVMDIIKNLMADDKSEDDGIFVIQDRE